MYVRIFLHSDNIPVACALLLVKRGVCVQGLIQGAGDAFAPPPPPPRQLAFPISI